MQAFTDANLSAPEINGFKWRILGSLAPRRRRRRFDPLWGGVFFRGNSLFVVSEGEKSPNGMPLRRERKATHPFRLERARRRPDPPGELLSGRSHSKWGVVVYQRWYFPLDNSTSP